MQPHLIQSVSKRTCNLSCESIFPIASLPNGRDNAAVRKMARRFPRQFGCQARTYQPRKIVRSEVLFHRSWIFENDGVFLIPGSECHRLSGFLFPLFDDLWIAVDFQRPPVTAKRPALDKRLFVLHSESAL